MNDSQSSASETLSIAQLYNDEGIAELSALFEQTGDEELLILAIEWALRMGQTAKASELLEHDFQDELASDYAQYFRSRSSMILRKSETSPQYLKLRPNSIFSPRFRQSLSHTDQEMNI